MYLNGILLISSALNFQAIRFDEGNDLPYALFLPAFIFGIAIPFIHLTVQLIEHDRPEGQLDAPERDANGRAAAPPAEHRHAPEERLGDAGALQRHVHPQPVRELSGDRHRVVRVEGIA